MPYEVRLLFLSLLHLYYTYFNITSRCFYFTINKIQRNQAA